MVSKNIRDTASTQEQEQSKSRARAEQQSKEINLNNPILIVRKAYNRLRTLTVQKKVLKVKFKTSKLQPVTFGAAIDGNVSATVVRKAKRNYLIIIWMVKSEGTHLV